ncbi:hypothetical protein [Amycolatopsis taiwanensis]|uniref:Prenyltransferase n=1 Tax=Amycolatopsis taiwanensis TaxID=342230 RepID=A0A9W6R3A2_9PSEU|nr:hypothetical protein [Amycolatopsis taiwanensis]GLY68339.1 hypothetical protein Atai01_49580 [Amycolatopsis taiwanensis]
MSIDLSAASAFMATHARVLDRRRYQNLLGERDPESTLAALAAYRNPDGGFGWGLEPDLRATESQPGAALHAFEVFAEVADSVRSPQAVALCDWLASVTLPDGGLSFALPVTNPTGCAPFWANADSTVSSLQISAIVAENAHRVAVHDADVAAHPWLDRITEYCLSAIANLGPQPHALVLAFAARFLDAACKTRPEAAELLDSLRIHVPANGLLHVEGGSPDEMMRPLDFAPLPGGPARRLFEPDVVDAELHRLANGQQPDGGWSVDFASYSPAAGLEWRGYHTVHALWILKENGLLGG